MFSKMLQMKQIKERMTIPKKVNINKILKTEMDRRMERIREFLLHEEQLLPTTRSIYDTLIKKVKNDVRSTKYDDIPRHRDEQ